ncbi:MAG: phosphatidylglycerophosphatase A family protein [Gammaproteobacteria bacterium]
MSIFLKEFYGNSRLAAKDIIKDPVLFLAFGFGSGLAKKMPGTFGTLAAVPLYLILVQTPSWLYLTATLLCAAVGVVICDKAAEKLEVHDYGGIVWDEIAGLLLTMYFVPFSWLNLLFGFALFRIFDILKPWPIKWVDQNVQGGYGIMLDDLIAGLFSGVLLIIWISLS